MPDLPVYDAVLLPPETVDANSVLLSRSLARLAPTEFVLETGRLYPHISLYMANFTPGQLGQATAALHEIAGATGALPLIADHFDGNDQGMFELFYRKTEALTRLQQELIARLNPLRTGLRHRDPVGRVLADHLKVAPAEARANLERCGYDEVGAFFKPHITCARFKQRDFSVAEAALPQVESFTTVYTTLALCEMGEHGTCTRVVSRAICSSTTG
jgi:hypothetical protein